MALPDQWTTETVRANGVDLQCYRTGSGPSVVLAHGFGGSGRRWTRLGAALAGDHEVVAYDARGHGRSDAPETGYGLDDRIADLRGVVDALALDDPVLLGHSMGAATVAWAAARHPELPRRAVLVDPVGVHDEPEMDPDERAAATRERLATMGDQSVEETVAEFEADHPDAPRDLLRRMATAAEVDVRVAVEIAREGYPAPHREAFAEIACPALVLRSDRDVEERVRDLDAAEEFRDGRLVHVPDAGHYVFLDEYEAAYAELRTFLRRH